MKKSFDRQFMLAIVKNDIRYIEEILEGMNDEEKIQVLGDMACYVQKSLLDPLSDDKVTVYTRKALLSHVKENLGKAQNAIVYADFNNVKKINDTFGYEKGDADLKAGCHIFWDTFNEMNERLGTNMGMNIFRVGGDEFVLLVSGDESVNIEEFVEQFMNLGKVKAANCADEYPEDKFLTTEEFRELCEEFRKVSGNQMVDYAFGTSIIKPEKDIRGALKRAITEADEESNKKKDPNRNESYKRAAMEEYIYRILDNISNDREDGITVFPTNARLGKTSSMMVVTNNENVSDEEERLLEVLATKRPDEVKSFLMKEIELCTEDRDSRIKKIAEIKNAVFDTGRMCLGDGTQILAKTSVNSVDDIVNNHDYKCLVFMLEDLKIINEANGHQGGDAYLSNVVNIIGDAIVEKQSEELDQRPNFIIKDGNKFTIFVKSESAVDVQTKITDVIQQYNDALNRRNSSTPRISWSGIKQIEVEDEVTFIESEAEENSLERFNGVYEYTKNAFECLENEAKCKSIRMIVGDQAIEPKVLFYHKRSFISLEEIEKYISENLQTLMVGNVNYRRAAKIILGQCASYKDPDAISIGNGNVKIVGHEISQDNSEEEDNEVELSEEKVELIATLLYDYIGEIVNDANDKFDDMSNASNDCFESVEE